MVPNGPKSTWEEQAEDIVAKGYPAAEPLLPDLVAWLRDINWPGADMIAQFLVSIGQPAIVHIRAALRSGDRTWINWILREVVSKWPTDLVIDLEPDLSTLKWEQTAALLILAEHHIGNEEDLLNVVRLRRSALESGLRELERVERYLSS